MLESISRNLEKEGISWVELGGVLPNPRLSLVYEGIEIAKKEDVDFVIAIGGGSVIDSAKAIGLGAVIKGDCDGTFLQELQFRNPLFLLA